MNTNLEEFKTVMIINLFIILAIFLIPFSIPILLFYGLYKITEKKDNVQ
jgi:hypothetical protein